MSQLLQTIHDAMRTTNFAVLAMQTCHVLAKLQQHLRDPHMHLAKQYKPTTMTVKIIKMMSSLVLQNVTKHASHACFVTFCNTNVHNYHHFRYSCKNFSSRRCLRWRHRDCTHLSVPDSRTVRFKKHKTDEKDAMLHITCRDNKK